VSTVDGELVQADLSKSLFLVCEHVVQNSTMFYKEREDLKHLRFEQPSLKNMRQIVESPFSSCMGNL